MPDDLHDIYLRPFSADCRFSCPVSHFHSNLSKMLHAVRVDASGYRSTKHPPTATAFVQKKQSWDFQRACELHV